MTVYVSTGKLDGKVFSGQTGKLCSLAKSKYLLMIKSRSQLTTQS